MVLEISVGRSYKSSIVGSFNAINKRFEPLSLITVGVTFLITSYYIVILGWVLTYLLFSILNITIDFNLYINTFYPIIAFIIALLINAIIIKAGVVKGIERISMVCIY
jgi:SNF family Na+-dependent transporter